MISPGWSLFCLAHSLSDEVLRRPDAHRGGPDLPLLDPAAGRGAGELLDQPEGVGGGVGTGSRLQRVDQVVLKAPGEGGGGQEQTEVGFFSPALLYT